MLKFIFHLLTIVVIISCNSPTESNAIKPSSEFFPPAVGNYWEYEESFTSVDTSYSVNYISRITKNEEVGSFNWSKIESIKNDYTEARFLMMENDSVYELQYN